MSYPISDFPQSLTPWDGLSLTRDSRHLNVAPDGVDWKKYVSELIGLQQADAAYEARLKVQGDKPGAAVTGLLATESRFAVQKTVLSFDNVSVDIVEDTTAFGTQPLYTFPEGCVLILGAVVDLTIVREGEELNSDAQLVASIGSAPATQGATLTDAEADIVSSTPATLADGAGDFEGASSGVLVLDGTQAPASAHLNFACAGDQIDDDDDSLLVNGAVTLLWIPLGSIS